MGATYTDAQKRASKRYTDSTDQIRVRTEKGNLDFIKEHAMSMGESLGEFVNRAISETIYRDRGDKVIEAVKSEEYGINGTLLLSEDNYYELDANICGKRSITLKDKAKDVPEKFISDYGWMQLENEYENSILGEN